MADSFGRKLRGYSILGVGYGILATKGVLDELGNQSVSNSGVPSFDDYSWAPYLLNSLTGYAGLELIISNGNYKNGELGTAGTAGMVFNPVIGAGVYYFGRECARTLEMLFQQ